MKTAIVVGHDVSEQGAVSKILDMTEYRYNCKVADVLCKDFDVYYRDPKKRGYNAKMEELARQINGKNYDFVIELHFNKFDGIANKKGHGCEAVIFPSNKKSRELSNKILNEISKDFGVFNRGVKEHGKGERGYGFLSKINSICVILEPFFGDENEALKFLDFEKSKTQFVNSASQSSLYFSM
jgi:N-acetylmuramoyl-L-alanine amidase